MARRTPGSPEERAGAWAVAWRGGPRRACGSRQVQQDRPRTLGTPSLAAPLILPAPGNVHFGPESSSPPLGVNIFQILC